MHCFETTNLSKPIFLLHPVKCNGTTSTVYALTGLVYPKLSVSSTASYGDLPVQPLFQARDLCEQLAHETVSDAMESSISRMDDVCLRRQSETRPSPAETLVRDNVLQHGSSQIPSKQGDTAQQSKVISQVKESWGKRYGVMCSAWAGSRYRVRLLSHEACKWNRCLAQRMSNQNVRIVRSQGIVFILRLVFAGRAFNTFRQKVLQYTCSDRTCIATSAMPTRIST